MTRIGFLIPEFPGQTHAFFIRERAELSKLGVATDLISTRRPVAGASAANHPWAEDAARETTYLYPMRKRDMVLSGLGILSAGPKAWWRCFSVVSGKSDMGAKERLKMLAIMLSGAYLKRICRQKSLSHVHVHSCANAANVALFSRLLGGPSYSLTLHGPMQDYGSNQARKWQHASFCIVITKELMQEVTSKLAGTPLPPLLLAPMGVNIDKFQRSNDYVAPQAGDEIKLVSCGRLNFVKAHDDLIRVVAKLKARNIRARLRICGAMDSLSDAENYHDQLIRLRDELALTEQIEFLGSVSEARVRQELEDAHFFCLASLKEPLGVATMEAMAMELPAIVTRSPGVSEMVDNSIDGMLVEPRKPEQFVDVIEELIADADKAMAIAKAGRQKVVEKFHSGVSAAKIAHGLEQHAKA